MPKKILKKTSAVLGAFAVCAFAVCALAACAPSVNTVENADAGANKSLMQDKRVITDWGTEDFADIIEIRAGTTADGQNLRVQIEIENSDNDDVGRLSYRVEWFDAQGLKIEIPSAWIPLAVQPRKRETITLVAPVPAARDFRVSFKRSE